MNIRMDKMNPDVKANRMKSIKRKMELGITLTEDEEEFYRYMRQKRWS